MQFAITPLKKIYQFRLFPKFRYNRNLKPELNVAAYLEQVVNEIHRIWWIGLLAGVLIGVATQLHVGIAQKIRQVCRWIAHRAHDYYEYYLFLDWVKLRVWSVICNVGTLASQFCALHRHQNPPSISTAMPIFYGTLSLLEGLTHAGRRVLRQWLAFVVRAYLLRWIWKQNRHKLWGTDKNPATHRAFAQVFFCLSFFIGWWDHSGSRAPFVCFWRGGRLDIVTLFLRHLSYGYILKRLWQEETQSYPIVKLSRSITASKNLIQWMQSREGYCAISQMGSFEATNSNKASLWKAFFQHPTMETFQRFQNHFQKPLRDSLPHSAKPHLARLMDTLRCPDIQRQLCTAQQNAPTEVEGSKSECQRFITLVAQVLTQVVEAQSIHFSTQTQILKVRGYEKRQIHPEDKSELRNVDFGFLAFGAFFQLMVPLAGLKALFLPA